MDSQRLESILSRYECDPWDLIPVLQDIQDAYSYLPKDELQEVAQRLDVPLTQLEDPACRFEHLLARGIEEKAGMPGVLSYHPAKGKA